MGASFLGSVAVSGGDLVGGDRGGTARAVHGIYVSARHVPAP